MSRIPGPGPLAGVRVIEMVGIGPAPLACSMLVDLGADVLSVQRPNARPFTASDHLGRGRPTLILDLKNERDRFLSIAGHADVLVEGYRPGVMERLGLGPADLEASNPRLVYGRMTGWGQDGPRSRLAGHDLNYISLTGALHAIGPADGAPVPPLNLVGDFGGGTLFLLVGILAALIERDRSGRGQTVDAAMVDGAATLMTMTYRMLQAGEWADRREDNLVDGGLPWYAVYECADGGHVAVGCLERPFYDEMVARVGLEDLPSRSDTARRPELRARLAAAFAARTRDEWAAVFADSDACVSPVLSLVEAPDDTHLRARGTFVDRGFGPEPGPAPRFSRSGTPTASGTPSEESASDLLVRWGLPRA